MTHERAVLTSSRRTDLAALGGPLSGVLFVSALLGAMKLAKSRFPRPGTEPALVRGYYTDSTRAVAFSATGQLLSAATLAAFTSSVTAVARSRSGTSALPIAATLTGSTSVACLTVAAATHASLAVHSQRTDQEYVSTTQRVFNLGGPVHGICFGLFTGVVAEIGRRSRLLGRPRLATGALAAAAGVLTPAYYKWENAGWLIPIGRFGGYAVCGIFGARCVRGGWRATLPDRSGDDD